MSYKRIAVAVSGDQDDKLLVDRALAIARHNDAHLILIHINDGLSDLYPGVYVSSAEDTLQTININSNKQLLQFARNIKWSNKKLRIERGEIPEALLEITQDEGCDLLICGHHHSFLNRLMPAYRGIINKITVDLLIIPIICKR